RAVIYRLLCARLRSKDSLLLSQRPKRSHIRDSKRHAVLRVVASSEIKSPVLEADPAAVGVVGHLRGGELQDGALVVIIHAERGVPPFAILVPHRQQT